MRELSEIETELEEVRQELVELDQKKKEVLVGSVFYRAGSIDWQKVMLVFLMACVGGLFSLLLIYAESVLMRGLLTLSGAAVTGFVTHLGIDRVRHAMLEGKREERLEMMEHVRTMLESREENLIEEFESGQRALIEARERSAGQLSIAINSETSGGLTDVSGDEED